MKNTVITRFDVDGFHYYIDAPKEVAFLSFKHRHMFVITCGYTVEHLDREQEIFICRDAVCSYLFKKFGNPCQFENMSCEMIAEDVLKSFKKNGMIWCEVWEENTGGARVEL